jgi:hypothetical protein
MKKRIILKEGQLRRLVEADELLANDPISKRFDIIGKRLSIIWGKISDINVSELPDNRPELLSIKDELEVMQDKMFKINAESEVILGKIEAQFGEEKMFIYDDHYNKLSSDVSNKIDKLLDFVDALLPAAKYDGLSDIFKKINI